MNIKVKKSVSRTLRSSEIGVEEYVHEGLMMLWQDAVEAFILEAQKYIAVDTGMSAASMIPLASEVGIDTLLRASIMRRRKRLIAIDQGYRKSMQAGEAAGSSAYRLTYGTPLVPRLSFTFTIVVLQYNIWEDVWQSLNKAKLAFDLFIRTNYRNYIDPDTLGTLMMLRGNNV